MKIFDFPKLFQSTKTSDKPINIAMISEANSEIYLVSDTSIAVWSLNKGIQLRRYENIVESKILSFAMDKLQQEFFVGLENGNIK